MLRAVFGLRFFRVPVAVALFVGPSACSLGSQEAPKESLHTISKGLQETLTSLRDPWGLYVEPAYFDQPGSVYTTAVLDAALGRSAPLVRDVDQVAREVCASPEKEQVTDPWFSWAVVRVLGRSDVECVELTAPAITGDASTDVPRYFAWADASLAAGVGRESLVRSVERVLKNPGSQGPYVMWRADQIEDLLGLTSTAMRRPAAPPRALRGPDDLTELWGYTMRCTARRELCTPSALPTDDQVAHAAVSYPDDLSLAGALAILRARGAADYVRELTAGVDARRVKGNGLVRHARFAGSVDSTFTVLALDYALFPGPRPAVTSAELLRRLALFPADDIVRRMRTLAILKAVDQEAWNQRYDDVEATFAKYDGMVVEAANLEHVIDVILALGAMTETPTPTLKIFAVNDQESEYRARLAAAYSWAFANDDEILAAYAGVRENALRQARQPREPVVFYLAGLQSLLGPGITLSAEDRAGITAALDKGLQGCVINGVTASEMYRFNVEPTSPCSLDITLGVGRSTFGVF